MGQAICNFLTIFLLCCKFQFCFSVALLHSGLREFGFAWDFKCLMHVYVPSRVKARVLLLSTSLFSRGDS